MEDKTIHYTLAFAVIFVFLLGINQLVLTHEKKALLKHSLSQKSNNFEKLFSHVSPNEQNLVKQELE